MGKNAKFRQKIKNMQERAKNRKEQEVKEKQKKIIDYQNHHPLLIASRGNEFSKRERKELRNFEKELLKDGDDLQI